ncbi:hypothetical protein GGI06_005874 [Coemansia sp. S85]|nr:hypothetical protein GGI06_005874 [Coemansia sp. S85]
MVKERSYKILEQLDEFELQEPAESSVAAYHGEAEQSLTRDSHTNVVPSAMDSDDEGDDSDDDYKDTSAGDTNAQPRPPRTEEAVAAAPAVGSSNPGGAQGAAARSAGPNPTDGVFANLAAKPELYLGYDDKVPTESLPTYQDIYGPQSNSAPPYFETAVISVGDEDELLVEGLPVGSIGSFMVNLVVSTAFQVVGYMLTFLLHGSHAAKNGSLAGLGITFMNFGFYIRTHLGQNIFDDPSANYPPGQTGKPGRSEDSDTPLDNAYFAYLLMVIGAGIFIKAVFDYVRVRRLQTIIESSPEQNV